MFSDPGLGWQLDTNVRSNGSIERANQHIRDWWSWQADTDQPAWAYLFGVGEIDADIANAWSDAVWPVPEPEACEEES